MGLSEAQQRHILGIDIVRFTAAMAVMLYHFDRGWAGWVGVEVFFVLSGFVISYSAVDQTPAQFFRARFVRLVPTIWLCATATAAVYILTGTSVSEVAERYLKTLILWPGGPWIDGAYWTLVIEVAFYAVVWLTLFRRRFSLETALRAMAIASAAYWATHYAQHFRLSYPVATAVLACIPITAARVFLLGYGCYFALGGFLYLSLRGGVTVWRIAFSGLCLATGLVQIVFEAANSVPPGGHRIVPVLIWLALSGAIVLSAVANGIAWRLLGRWAPTIRLVGLATYPLYLLHDDIGQSLMQDVGIPAWAAMVAMICAAFAVAAWFEPPVQAWLRKVMGAKSRVLTPAEPVGSGAGPAL